MGTLMSITDTESVIPIPKLTGADGTGTENQSPVPTHNLLGVS